MRDFGAGKAGGTMELFISVLIVFRFVFKNGNFDLLYFWGAGLLVYYLFRNQRVISKSFLLILPFVVISIITAMFSPYFSSWAETGKFLSKMIFNMVLFVYIKNNINSFNVNKCVYLTTDILTILTFFAFVFQNSFLWKTGDKVNRYSETRLQLFYLEPSLLSMTVGVLLLFIVYFMLQQGMTLSLLLRMAELTAMILLSAGLNGIVCSAVSLLVVFLLINTKKLKNKKISISVLLFTPIAVFTILIVFSGNYPIVQRLYAVLSGNDSSFNYRFYLAWDALKVIMQATHFTGFGLGNMNTENAMAFLRSLNMTSVFANSFMYFIAEAGIPGILYLLGLNFYILKRALVQNRFLSIPLFVFIFLYQIGGGYFTNPLIWALYGVICSDFKYKLNITKNDSCYMKRFQPGV